MQWFIFIVLASIFLLTPMQNGLYFSYNIYPITILAAVVGLAFVVRQFWNNELYQVRKGLIVLLLPVCYLIALPFAESPKGAWDSVLKWVLYSVFFILLVWVSSNPKIKGFVPLLFHILGAFLVLSMIFSYYGWTYVHNAVLNGRFGGVFQYANTFGMVMIVFFFYSLLMLTDKKIKKGQLLLNSFLLVAYMVCFIQSYSRGMLLFFPLIWLLGLVLLPFVKQLKYVCYSFISIGSSLLVYQAMVNGEAEKSLYPGLLSFLLLTFVTMVCVYYLNKRSFDYRFTRIKGLRLLLPIMILTLCLLGLWDLKSGGLLYNTLPDKLQERISGISLSTATAKERLNFYQDALKMSKDSPIIGFGGEGWSAVYKNYQSEPYISNKIHNGFLEWMVDLGWIGFTIFLAVFVYLLFMLVRSYWVEKDSSVKIAVILSLLIIFMHSTLDFNFSYGTVWLLAFWLFAIGLGTIQVVDKPKKMQNRWGLVYPKIAISVCALLLVVSLIQSYNFLNANKMYEQAKKAQSYAKKELFLEKAVAMDESNTKYSIELSKVYMSKLNARNDSTTRNKLQLLLTDMAEAEPRNSTVLYHVARVYEKLGQNEEAIQYYDAALDVDHFNYQLYQESIALKVKLAMKNKENNQQTEMNELLKSAFADYKQEKSWLAKTDQSEEGKVFNSRDFHISTTTEFYVALGYFLIEDYTSVKKIVDDIEPSANIENELLAMKILSLDKLYEKYESELLLQNALKTDQNFIKVIQKYREIM
jgi:tetratricopeptide (TPR) repeat protein